MQPEAVGSVVMHICAQSTYRHSSHVGWTSPPRDSRDQDMFVSEAENKNCPVSAVFGGRGGKGYTLAWRLLTGSSLVLFQLEEADPCLE